MLLLELVAMGICLHVPSCARLYWCFNDRACHSWFLYFRTHAWQKVVYILFIYNLDQSNTCICCSLGIFFILFCVRTRVKEMLHFTLTVQTPLIRHKWTHSRQTDAPPAYWTDSLLFCCWLLHRNMYLYCHGMYALKVNGRFSVILLLWQKFLSRETQIFDVHFS